MAHKHILIITCSLLVTGMVLSLPATAAQTLDWGSHVNPSACDNKKGAPVITITQKVMNTVDSGEGGNNWAFDNFTRVIQVWAQKNGAYCALVKYAGRFDAQAGQTSPGAGGTLDGDEDGPFVGGYHATITGTLRAAPLWKRYGSVGTTNYQCDIAGNCPGAINWVDQYFEPGNTFTYGWWGWIYYGGIHGTWINAVSGNSGDIL